MQNVFSLYKKRGGPLSKIGGCWHILLLNGKRKSPETLIESRYDPIDAGNHVGDTTTHLYTYTRQHLPTYFSYRKKTPQNTLHTS